ncbi:MAG: ABC transporter ATP-binding protein [Bacteroidetes bacterium]|nr:MAG: ABC transporter ATP-binding protein [Bacteroidota bacterium]
MLKIDNVVKQYAEKLALNGVSFEVPSGSIFGLLGPNGAGKTSLIRIITGITGADSGHIYFNGEPLGPSHIGTIGYLPEERGLYKKMPIQEQAMYFARLKGLSRTEAKQAIDHWFDKFDINSWRTKKVEDLSKGMQQKVQFIITILHNPKLIILDEPFTGFDPVNAELVRKEIIELRSKGATIILSTHRMESVEQMCDHIALINNSQKVLDGKLQEIKQQYKKNLFETITDVFDPQTIAGYTVTGNETLPDGRQKTIFSVEGDNNPNRLLQQLLPVTSVHSFSELLPTINDIFISLVSNNEIPATA